MGLMRCPALLALVAFDLLVVAGLCASPRAVRGTIDPAGITHVGAMAFQGGVSAPVSFPFALPADSAAGPRSSLRLYEATSALGAGHSSYQSIADLGGGRFLHWTDGTTSVLYFSSSDATDPRHNGRAYHWEGRTRLDRRLVIAGLLLLLAQLALGLAWVADRKGNGGTTLTAAVTLSGLAALHQWLVLDSGRPRVLNMGDPGMVAGIIASSLHPERFASDPTLGPGSSVAFYATVLRPLVGLADALVADLGTAYLLLSGPLMLAQGLGFYSLGAFILSNRWHALLLALLTLPPVYTNGGDLWGIADEPLTRMLYGAALPFLLLAFLRFYERRLAFVWLAMLAAATVYLHPVSQPSVAASCLLGALMAGNGATFRRRLTRTVASGLVMLVCMLPYAAVYFSSGVGRMDEVIGSALAGEEKRRLLEEYFGPLYYDVRLAVRALAEGGMGSGQGPWGWRWLVWGGGFLGLGPHRRLRTRRHGSPHAHVLRRCLAGMGRPRRYPDRGPGRLFLGSKSTRHLHTRSGRQPYAPLLGGCLVVLE